MKLFLFMFPIKRFMEEIPRDLAYSFNSVFRSTLFAADLYGINEIIEARYRAKGFEVAWVFYGKHGQLHLPDTHYFSKYFTHEPEDLDISCGSCYRRFEEQAIFDQLPVEEIEQLVVGGFHWQCCPAIAAEYATEVLGIPTCIDEDTTQAYFAKVANLRLDKRCEYPIEGLLPFEPWHINGWHREQEHLYRLLVKYPWLVREWDHETFTFRFDRKEDPVSFPRQEVEEYWAGEDAKRRR